MLLFDISILFNLTKNLCINCNYVNTDQCAANPPTPPHTHTKNLLSTFELMLIAKHCMTDVLFW